MKMRMLQISCLLVLGLVASSASVDARWEGPCVGKRCTQCDVPNPSGAVCWTSGSCQTYGCTAFATCGTNDQYAQCECEPCAGGDN